ncbi:MAG: flavodoxin family protein [Candidatus Glassbacteria bacterium]|nr:flavodoxin family protein [Candidatus Glassbacteria bacterium]
MSELRVLALSGSPRPQSFTHHMLELFLEPLSGSAEVSLFVPRKMNIGPCLGCFHCWSRKTPGECSQKDDFAQIIEAYKSCDLVVLAAPLYVFGFPATLKNVLDRFFITLEPDQLPLEGGGTTHPKRYQRRRRAVLISSCGFPEMENFDLLREHFRIICKHTGWENAGEVLLPAAGAYNGTPLAGTKDRLLRATGEEFLREGRVSGETLAALAEAPFSHEEYRNMANWAFKGSLLEKGKMVALTAKIMARVKKKQKEG